MNYVYIGLVLSLVLMVSQNVKGRPREIIGDCEYNVRFQDTCQKCAKITKSPVVYPMCCNDEDEVYLWCEKYVYYGIH